MQTLGKKAGRKPSPRTSRGLEAGAGGSWSSVSVGKF